MEKNISGDATDQLIEITEENIDEYAKQLQFDTLVRECKEELGVDVDINKAELLMTLKRDLDFVDIYLLRQDFEIENMTLQKEEVDGVKWVLKEDVINMYNNNEFHEGHYNAFLDYLNYKENK